MFAVFIKVERSNKVWLLCLCDKLEVVLISLYYSFSLLISKMFSVGHEYISPFILLLFNPNVFTQRPSRNTGRCTPVHLRYWMKVINAKVNSHPYETSDIAHMCVKDIKLMELISAF